MSDLIARLRGHVYSKIIAVAVVGLAVLLVNVANSVAEVYPGMVGAVALFVAPIVAGYLKREAKVIDPSVEAEAR